MTKVGFFIFLTVVFLAAAGVSSSLQADTLIIPVGQQASEAAAIQRPKTGALRAEVAEQFGEPLRKNAAKGSPPISSWEYQDFVVYFEHDHVIHAVLKHRPYVD